jgi:hypothetical protein
MADKPRGKVTFKRRPQKPVVGPQGEQGPAGADGIDGKDGRDGIDGAIGPEGPQGLRGQRGEQGLDGAEGLQGERGPRGFKGAKGDTGPAGADGADGQDGADGLSAYEIWLKEGNKGTRSEFLRSLIGKKGVAAALEVLGGGGGRAAALTRAPRIDGEPNGFIDRTQVTLDWDNGTRTLTVGGSHAFYSDSNNYGKSDESIQIADTEGAHFIYYDSSGVLQEVDTFDLEIILRYCFVAEIYWDATNKVAIPWVVNELHGCEWPAEVHEYMHSTQGAAYISGLGLSNLVVSNNPNGDDDNQCQFTAEGGEIRDEDISQGIQIRNSVNDLIPVLWREGTEAAPVWRMDDTRSFPVTNQGTVAGRVMWNQLTGGSWQLTEVAANNNFVLAHIYAIPGLNTATGNLVALVGQGEYSTVTAAREAAQAEADSLSLDGLPSLEFVLAATLIVKTNATWDNTTKTGFVTTDTGADYIDWRQQPRTASPGDSGHIHEPKSATLTRDVNGAVETVTVEGEATWTLSRNPNESVASLTDGTYNVAVDRDGNGIVTGVTVT